MWTKLNMNKFFFEFRAENLKNFLQVMQGYIETILIKSTSHLKYLVKIVTFIWLGT